MTSNTIYFVGDLTATDWEKARDETIAEDTPRAWHTLFDNYFQQRLDLRYLNPIKTLQIHDTKKGEGFSITALQCILIEFLAANRKGKTYRHGHPETEEFYSNSRALFVEFLHTQKPFSTVFDAKSAESFYVNVRCGLLHEARTKGRWTIWADALGEPFVDTNQLIVYRNDLQIRISEYVARTRAEMATESALQAAFVQTFNSLSNP